MSAVLTQIRVSRAGRMAEGAIGVVYVLTLLSDMVAVITISTGHVLFALGGSDGRLPLSQLPQLLQADLREGTRGTLADADLGLRILSAAPTLVHAVTITLVALLLLGIIRRVSLGEPFSAGVLNRWKWLTVALLAGGALQAVVETIAVAYLAAGASLNNPERVQFLGGDYSGIGINIPQWPVPILLGGVIALALGVAFRSGARLQDEVEGVV
jgi:hypothetical protein